MGIASRDGVYSIGAVSKMLGIPAQTLRSWEDRYGEVIPERSTGGQRLYSRDQVDELRFVLDEIEGGMQPGDAHRMLKQRRLSPVGPRLGHQAPPSILVAERDPFSAELWEYFLRTEGYAVLVALHAEEALEFLDREPARLAVIDLLISGGAGLELCRFVRAHLDIPVIAVSVLDSADQALESGADAFLPKPLDHLRFVSTVRDLLGTSSYLHSRVTAP